ncbi:MAG: hypothetical protein ACI4TK_16765 [Agathobacter sp.]
MLLSSALVLMVGMVLGWICKKCKLPSLLGMLVTGIILEAAIMGTVLAADFSGNFR